MAKIEYNGMTLEEVTEPQIFDPPKTMVAWDDNGPTERKNESITKVFAILSKKHTEWPVVTMNSRFGHCALLPEKIELRRATNRELAKWLAQGNGELLGNTNGDSEPCCHSYNYLAEHGDMPCLATAFVRKWADAEWHIPTVDYLGING